VAGLGPLRGKGISGGVVTKHKDLKRDKAKKSSPWKRKKAKDGKKIVLVKRPSNTLGKKSRGSQTLRKGKQGA